MSLQKPKAPRIYVKPNETYQEAQVRFRVKWAHYRDMLVVYELTASRNVSVKGRQFHRAFYGVEMHYVTEVV